MTNKTLPFSKQELEDIIQDYPTPFHIYDEQSIRENIKLLKKSFSWNSGFKEYFAVKATPNPFLMKIMKQEGLGMDCSSLPELLLSEQAGIIGNDIMFSSNDTPASEFQKARELDAIINLDDINHIHFLEQCCGIPEIISIRYNPGKMRTGSFIMGNPEEAKYGFTRPQVIKGLKMLKEKGVKKFGLHTFIASNELDYQYFINTAEMLFDLALEICSTLNIEVSFINISGGIGIPYREEESALDINKVSHGIKERYNAKIKGTILDPLALYMECGRMITGPYGYMVSRVLHKKETYKTFIGLDSCMANLMRPAVYDAYHHITIPGKENDRKDFKYDITGSLCESNDRFAVDRYLPEIQRGDLVVIHDTGAHGHAMGFNYNGKLRSSELLIRLDGSIKLIRRAETVEDYFATLPLNELENFK